MKTKWTLLVAGLLLSGAVFAQSTLPFQETFDTLGLGSIDGANGWSASGFGSAIVQNTNVYAGSQALTITEASASHLFSGTAAKVWASFRMKPTLSVDPPENIPTDASAVFYFSTNNLLVAYDGSTVVEVAGASRSSGWNEVDVFFDYDASVWSLKLNGTRVITDFSFYGTSPSLGEIRLIESFTNSLVVDSIDITDLPAFSVSPIKLDLSADIGQTVFNSDLVISNHTDQALLCQFSDAPSWLTLSSIIGVDPHSAKTQTVSAVYNSQAALTGTFTGSYSITNDFIGNADVETFTVNFNVGAQIKPLVEDRAIVEFGGVNTLNPDIYEPGEILEITIPSTNNGALIVSNILNTLSADPTYFSIAPASDTYAVMAMGDSTSTTYTVTIDSNTPHGSYTFYATNAADGFFWSDSFTLDVVKQAFPSVSPANLTINVFEGQTGTGGITLTNAGNQGTTFSITDNGSWFIPYAVSTKTASMATFLILHVPNPETSFTNWNGNSTVAMPIGFDFPLFGTRYDEFSVSRYGAISFNTTVGDNTNSPPLLPSGTSPVVAPFWGNTLVDADRVRYEKTTEKLVVSWGHNTGAEFQAWLYPNGEIQYFYEKGTWGDAAIGIQDASHSDNIDFTPGAAKRTLLLTPSGTPWVTYEPITGSVAAMDRQIITFTADATDQAVGSTVFTNTITWGDGSTDDVVVTVVVSTGSPGLEISEDHLFLIGSAGAISRTNTLLINTGEVALAYTITDTGARDAGYAWSNTTFRWQEPFSHAYGGTAVILDDGDDKTAWMPIGFDFPFYGNVYTQFLVDVNNGVVLSTNPLIFLGPASANDMPSLNTTLDDNALIRYSGNANKLLITWENVRQTTLGNDQTFQAILYKEGSIRFQYETLSDTNAWLNAWVGLYDNGRITQATLSNEMTTVTTTHYTLIPIATNYHRIIYTTNITTTVTHNETITDQAIVFYPSNRVVLTVDPASGTLPVGSTQGVYLYGDARDLTPGGGNNILADTTFDIAYAGGTQSLYVAFIATNSVETSFGDMRDSDEDGRSDVEEILFGSDGEISVVRNADNSHTISWPDPTPASLNRNFIVWYTTDLMGGWIKLKELGNITTYTDTEHADEPVIFYKVTAE